MLLPQYLNLCRPGESGTTLTMLTARRSFTSESIYLEACQEQTAVQGSWGENTEWNGTLESKAMLRNDEKSFKVKWVLEAVNLQFHWWPLQAIQTTNIDIYYTDSKMTMTILGRCSFWKDKTRNYLEKKKDIFHHLDEKCREWSVIFITSYIMEPFVFR